MSAEWRITFYDGANGSQIAQYTQSNPGGIASIDSVAVNGLENCEEATFSAKPSDMASLVPGDQVEIETKYADEDNLKLIYVGLLVTVGNTNSNDLQTYKAVGYKEFFFDLLVPDLDATDEVDAKTAAQSVITSLGTSDLPVRFSTTVDSVSAGQVIKATPVGNKTAGELLDELATLAGPFVVESGETFTYNGVTFESGDIVPGIRWGIKPGSSGPVVFFERPVLNNVSLVEGAENTRTTFREVNDEEFVNKVAVEYISDFRVPNGWTDITSEQDSNYEVSPSVAFFDFSNGEKRGRSRTVKLDNPFPFLVDKAEYFTGLLNGSNIQNAFDGDDDTFAFLNGYEENNGSVSLFFNVPETDPITFPRRVGAIVRVVLEILDVVDPNLEDASSLERVTLTLDYNNFVDLRYRFEGVDEKSEGIFFIPHIVELGELKLDTLKVRISSFTDVRLYSLQYFVLDLNENDAMERFARAFVTEPRTQATKHEVIADTDRGVSPLASFTTVNGSSETISIERVNHRVTTEDGYVVEYDLGQGFEAEALSEKSVIQGIARSVVRG